MTKTGIGLSVWSIRGLLWAGVDFGVPRVIMFCVMVTYILIALGTSASALDAAVEAAIPKEDRQQLEPGKWLLTSALVTSKDVSDQIGISGTATFIICPIRGYFGRTRSDVWEWLAAKSSAKG